MQESMVSGTTIRYESFGSGAPIVMLHGWGADHRVSMRMLEPIFEARTGWRRIYPDLPGMGSSPASDQIRSHDDMLYTVARFIESLVSDERFAIGGVSYGGYLAQGIVHRFAAHLDGLLLVVPSVERNPARQRYPEHRVLATEPAFATSLKPEEGWLFDAVVVQSLRVLEQVRGELLPALDLADVAFLQSLGRDRGFSFDVTTLDQPFDVPALVLVGRQDSVTGFREAIGLLEQFTRGTFAVLDTAGHMLHREQTAVFRSLVSEWADRVDGYRASASTRGNPQRKR